MRVLVIDDDEATARLVERVCIEAGHTAAVLFSGTQTVGALATFEPQVVLLDWMLSDADGAEVALAIRAWPGPQPLILMMTSLEPTAAAQHAAGAGIDGLVSKPLRSEHILRTMSSVLRRAQLTQVSAS
jgi:DNA-binding response OmpR family regulator